MEPVREYLKQNRLLFDGGMGTYYLSRYPGSDPRCELQNLENPARILEIHREYREAGAKALKTNTFGANTVSLECGFNKVREVLEAGYALACRAAGEEAYVFADIGPSAEPEERRAIAEVFLAMGAKNFLFETYADSEGLAELCRFVKFREPEAFVIVSFAAAPDGFTRHGLPVSRLLQEMAAENATDAVGVNCVSGPAHLLRLLGEIPVLPKLLSVMPNSGYPTMVAGRTYFESSATYFAGCMARIAEKGAAILGGCCGTTPAYIAETAKLLPQVGAAVLPRIEPAVPAPGSAENRGVLEQKLLEGRRIVAVELDPPVDADGSFFLESAARLKALGVDAITIADCPVARVRADSSMLAAKLKRELDIEPIPHMTCRDRNLNASKALLLGLCMEGVRNLLVVTGDPVPNASRDEVKAVFNFNSAMLAGYARTLGEELGSPFLIAGALNVNAANFDAELEKALRKKENGVRLLLTQPVFTEEAVENLRRAREETGLWILGGILPAVSYRNACYMHNEISGIRLNEEILEQYRLAPDKEAAARLGVELSLRIAEQIAPYVNGYYLMTPFKRIDLIEEIVRGIS